MEKTFADMHARAIAHGSTEHADLIEAMAKGHPVAAHIVEMLVERYAPHPQARAESPADSGAAVSAADSSEGEPAADAGAGDAAGAVETKVYSDGTTATGTAPLPNLSPAQQDAASVSGGKEEGNAPQDGQG